jgi:hypothetical protein
MTRASVVQHTWSSKQNIILYLEEPSECHLYTKFLDLDYLIKFDVKWIPNIIENKDLLILECKCP